MKVQKEKKQDLPEVESFYFHPTPCIQWAMKLEKEIVSQETLCRHQCGCTCLCPIPPDRKSVV